MIDISNVLVELKGTKLSFDDITFGDKRVTFLKGRNGSGKTTLMKVIGGLIPFTGSVKLQGSVTYNNQEPVLFRRSVLQNIQYPLQVRGLVLEDYYDEIITYATMLHIDHLMDKDATQLSSGEKMKVSIIRSIIFKPNYVLLDEPTTHLDFESILELIQLIKTLQNELSFIIVSHNKQFIDALEQDAILLGGNHVYSERD